MSVILKVDGEVAQLCDYCETLWLQNESVNAQTGHDFEGYKEAGVVYTIEEPEAEDEEDAAGDEDNKATSYPKYT